MALSFVAFDAYGTLLDVHSAVARHADRIGPVWQALSQDWRAKQLEYAWVRSLAGPARHRDFARVTDDALASAAAKHGVRDVALLASLRDAFDALDAYPEAAPVLSALRNAGVGRAILSNGTPSMLTHATRAARIDTLLDAVWSVETVGVYKPDPRVYRLAVDGFGVVAGRIAFVSSNAWDAFGALTAGLRVFWINRGGQPDEYDLARHVTILPDLSDLPARLAA